MRTHHRQLGLVVIVIVILRWFAFSRPIPDLRLVFVIVSADDTATSAGAAFNDGATFEHVTDLATLRALLEDPVTKTKYQQQVNVFIVGFDRTCQQRLSLLNAVQQVSGRMQGWRQMLWDSEKRMLCPSTPSPP